MRKTIFFCLFLSACTTSQIKQDLHVEFKYKRDLALTVNNLTARGVIVVPKQDKYLIAVKSPDQMDAFLIQTCHREILLEGIGREHSFTFIPVKGLEDEGSCPMFMSGITKKRERISLGMIDFYSGQTLPASLNCSGLSVKSEGVSICQAPQSLWQEIEFDEDVKFVEPEGKCATQVRSNGRQIKYRMPNADCVVVFKGMASGKIHKANWIGFEDYVLKE